MGAPALQWPDLAIVSLLVLLNAGLSLRLQLGLHKTLLVAAVRSVVQLVLVGSVLVQLFAHPSPWATSGAALVMLVMAGREIAARQDRPLAGGWNLGIGTGAMAISLPVVVVFGLLIAARPDPWYAPHTAVPLLGMVLGNAMSGVSLGLQTLTQAVAGRKAEIEGRLLLGQSRHQALQPLVRQAIRSAWMPLINMMTASGVVALPGMMTGQILGGSPPQEAVKYQLLILFLLAGGSGLGSLLAVYAAAHRLTDERDRLRLDRLTKR